MNNSENLYYHAKKYQDERKAIVDNFEKRMKALEDTKGSKYYVDEKKKAEKERDNALNTLKAEYRGGFDSILKEMRNVSESRGATPPTDEELRIIQALKLKDKVTEAELDRIANAVKNNGLCLSVVQDVASKNGIVRNYVSLCTEKTMPAVGVEECIKSLTSGIKDFIDYDTSRAARLAREAHERMYGKIDEDTPVESVLGGARSGYVPVTKRQLFDTKEGFYSIVGGIKGATLAAFTASVDN